MDELKVTIIMAEYNAYKEEIRSTKETIRSIVNYVFILLAALFSFVVAIFSTDIQFENISVRLTFLVLPECFFLLSMYHTQCVMRLHRYSRYIDDEIGNKIKSITGEQLLNGQSKHETKNIFRLMKLPIDARVAFLSKIGIMLFSVALPLFFWLAMCIHSNTVTLPVEWILFSVGTVCIVALLFMQHD